MKRRSIENKIMFMGALAHQLELKWARDRPYFMKKITDNSEQSRDELCKVRPENQEKLEEIKVKINLKKRKLGIIPLISTETSFTLVLVMAWSLIDQEA